MATKIKFLIYTVLGAALIPAAFFGYRYYTLKEAQKKVGTIEINAVIYEDVDKGLSDIHSLNISKIFFMGDVLLEQIKENDTLKYCLFNKSMCTDYTSDLSFLSNMGKKNIKSKKFGAIPLSDTIPNYSNRIAMNDTILDEIKYKRFAVRNPNEYSVFYLQDNLNIPYSFNNKAEQDYKGTITRIDSYKITDDIFISITLKAENKIQRTFYNTLTTNYFKF